MNTITAHDVRRILDKLNEIDELLLILRKGHFDVPYRPVYDSVGAVGVIRSLICRAALTDVAVESTQQIAAE